MLNWLGGDLWSSATYLSKLLATSYVFVTAPFIAFRKNLLFVPPPPSKLVSRDSVTSVVFDPREMFRRLCCCCCCPRALREAVPGTTAPESVWPDILDIFREPGGAKEITHERRQSVSISSGGVVGANSLEANIAQLPPHLMHLTLTMMEETSS